MKRSVESLSPVIKRFSMLGIALVFSLALLPACGASYYQAPGDVGAENPADDVPYLARFGTWIDVEPYGMVWQPSVSPDWQPFSLGHWIWTDEGWAWVSYEPYGWLVYHYGNWDYRSDIGWFWIEGADWSPAPVQWMNYDGYCAWAPLPYDGNAWGDPWTAEGADFWITVPLGDLDRDDIGHYRVARPPHPIRGDPGIRKDQWSHAPG